MTAACGDDSSDGAASSGGNATTGGAASGGASPGGGTGAAASGGVAASGGAASGGAATGGAATGGAATGGAAGNGGAEPGGGAGGSTEAGAGGGGDEEIGGSAGVPNEPEDVPILERPVDGGYECELGAPLSRPGLPPNGELVAGSSPSLLWKEIQTDMVRGAVLHGVTPGAAYPVFEPAEAQVHALAAARNGERIAVMIQERNGTVNRFLSAEVDLTGGVTTEPHPLSGPTPDSLGVELVAAGDGYGLVWTEGVGATGVLKFARVDAGGNLVGEPKLLLEANLRSVDSLVWLGDGYAVAYSEYFASRPRSSYLAFDAEGTPYREPVLLGEPGVGLIRRGDYVIAAWPHGTGDPGNAFATNLRLGRFDARGRPVGEVYELQKQVVHEENLFPSWVEVGEELGLIWSHGSVIYLCGGCVPDHHLAFVLLDGSTLEPKSEVVTIENQETVGGLLRSQIVASDAGLLVVTNITYHVTAEAGLAAISCTP